MMNEEDYHKSIKKRKSSILIIWIIPFIALFIAGSMITKYFMNQGEPIIIVFSNADGFTIGKTPLKYKGIRIGLITDMVVNGKNNNEFFVTVTVDKSAIPLIGKHGTKFWKVEPKVSMGEISGLNTIISGSYIEVLPGHEEFSELNSRDFFIAQKSKPIDYSQEGLFFMIQSDKGNLVDGSPLLYKKYAVGKVVKKDLKKGTFYYTLFIDTKHASLIKETSHFWTVSGIDFKASLSGVELNVGSLSAIIAGGIAFDSPEESKVFKDTKHIFVLGESEHDSNHIKTMSGGKKFTLHVEELGSISIADPIYYKRIRAGEVVGFDYDKKSDSIDVSLFIKDEFLHLINSSTRFYAQSGIDVDIGRDHLKVSTQSMDTVLQGSLAFVVNDKSAQPVAAGYKFTLSPSELAAKAQSVFITLDMDRGYKLSKGSSVLYKDLKIGSVESLLFNAHNEVTAHLAIDKKYADLLRSDSVFWLDDFKVTAKGFSNVPAAIFGPSLCLMPGASERLGKHFTLSESAPFMIYQEEGLRIVVKGDRKSSLKPGSPLLYRQLKIGMVESYALLDDGTSVEIGLFIKKKYAHFIRKNSLFYHAGALGMQVSLSGLKVFTETVETMLLGGIGVVTPDDPGVRAQNGDRFDLALRANEEWFNWHPKLSH